MIAQPIGTISLKQDFSVIGLFRPFQCAGRHRGDRVQCLMMALNPLRLCLSALDLQPTRGQVAVQGFGPRPGGLQPSTSDVEGIPAQSDAPPDYHKQNQHNGQHHAPPPGAEHPQNGGRPHGNTLRSSSKCGPSRSVGQSPPQTMGVPCRTAAALKAAAMRGYSGQSQRT